MENIQKKKKRKAILKLLNELRVKVYKGPATIYSRVPQRKTTMFSSYYGYKPLRMAGIAVQTMTRSNRSPAKFKGVVESSEKS